MPTRRHFLQTATATIGTTGVLASTVGNSVAATGRGTLERGERVRTTDATAVRSDPDVSASNVQFTQPADERGTVVGGPEDGSWYSWYEIDWETGHSGWSPREKLALAGAFEVDQRVGPVVYTNVYESADKGSDVVGSVGTDTPGYVRDGPRRDGDVRLWRVAFVDGTTGWVSETNVEARALPEDVRRPQRISKYDHIDVKVAVTGDQLDDAIAAIAPHSPLIGLGDTWVATQDRYSIDAIYQAAHAAHESAWGRSWIARYTNNLYGFNAVDVCPAECASHYDSFEQCVRQVMDFVDTEYLSPGGAYYSERYGASLRGMNVHYARDKGRNTPPYDSAWWCDKIVDIYNLLVAEL